MVEQGSARGARVGDMVTDPSGVASDEVFGEPFDDGLDDLPVDPLGGVNRWTAADLETCPTPDEELQKVLADEHAERLVDAWWADPVMAQQEWDTELAALYAQVAADDRREAVARRVALDGAPGPESLTATLEVLAGSPAWTPTQAGTAEFVDTLQDGAVSGFAAARRLENHALWLQIATTAKVMTAWRGRTPALPRRTRSGRLLMDAQDVLVADAVAAELAVAAGISRGVAGYRVEAATALIIDPTLPMTAELLEQGRLDWARLRLIMTRTRELSVAAIGVVERILYATPSVLEGTPRRFEIALTAAILVVDPDADSKRRQRARKGRRVSIEAGQDGTALFLATGPSEAVTAAYNGLDAAARYLRAHGDPRTLDQLRHDLFVTGCTSGYLPVPADELPTPPNCAPTGRHAPTTATPAPATPAPATPAPAPADTDASDTFRSATAASGTDTTDTTDTTDAADAADAAESSAAWFTTTWPDVQVTVNVTVSAETLMGLVDDPGTLQGYGPIPADAVRDLAKNGVFRCLVVDGTHGTVLGVGKSTFTPGYVPGQRLKFLLKHTQPTCTGPHCGKAAWRCDLDHQTPHARGGATCECDVRPLCRPCHRLKTAGLLVPEQRGAPGDPPGTTTWTTRTGRTWTALPHVPLPHISQPTAPAPAPARSASGAPRPAPGADDPPPF